MLWILNIKVIFLATKVVKAIECSKNQYDLCSKNNWYYHELLRFKSWNLASMLGLVDMSGAWDLKHCVNRPYPTTTHHVS